MVRKKLSEEDAAAAAAGAAILEALKRTKHGREFWRTTDPATRGRLLYLRDLNRNGR